ncbi:MAG: PIN domain-containing protein [Cyanobacteria bacterium P01_H01_bin.150]
MKVLIDADIVLELFINRSGFVEDAERLLVEIAQSQQIEVYVTDKCLKRIRLELGDINDQDGEQAACKVSAMANGRIIKIDRSVREQARKLPLKNFESAEQLACATVMQLDAIVTQNPQNFDGATFPIWSIESLLKRLQFQQYLDITNIINQVNEQYVSKNDLLENGNSNYLHVLHLVKNLYPVKKRKAFNFNIGLVIFSFIGGAITFAGVIELSNFVDNKKETSIKYASALQGEFYSSFSTRYAGNYFLSNADNTESVCNLNGSGNNQEIENYYISFKRLKDQIVMHKLQPSQVKDEVRELQVRAEKQQREAEKNQRYLEHQRELAEVQQNYDEAQRLKDQAKTTLSQSQQWLCLSRQAFNLSIR